MNRKVCYFFVLCCLCACNSTPSELRLNQLACVKYYRVDEKADKTTKLYFYYKPFIYSFSGKPYTGRVKDYTDNQKLKSEGFMKDGFPDGYWKYYNPDGSVKSEGIYRNGIKDSVWVSNYTDGTIKLREKYSFSNDTLTSDTINAWFYNGNKMLETTGDTVRRFYENGRLMAKTIKGAEKLHEVYLADGTVCFRTSNHMKEVFYTNGKLRSRMYYLRDKTGAQLFAEQKHNWSAEEKAAIKDADSILFDYSNYWDPVIKIYVKD